MCAVRTPCFSEQCGSALTTRGDVRFELHACAKSAGVRALTSKVGNIESDGMYRGSITANRRARHATTCARVERLETNTKRMKRQAFERTMPRHLVACGEGQIGLSSLESSATSGNQGRAWCMSAAGYGRDRSTTWAYRRGV